MADTNEKKISFWSGVKAEFGKIVWPNGKGAFRQSVADTEAKWYVVHT